MRAIICGGRYFNDYEKARSVLDAVHEQNALTIVFHGNARGADTMAQWWCEERGVKVFAVPAQWAKHGKRAGPIRNQNMLGHGIDLVVAFPGGRGTADMVRRARAAGVEVREIA